MTTLEARGVSGKRARAATFIVSAAESWRESRGEPGEYPAERRRFEVNRPDFAIPHSPAEERSFPFPLESWPRRCLPRRVGRGTMREKASRTAHRAVAW